MTRNLQQEIRNCLLVISNPNSNQDLKRASQEFLQLVKQSESILSLLNILKTDADISIRHSSAIQLRKLVEKHDGLQWNSLGNEDREAWKKELLVLASNEPQKLLRNAICHVVGAIARIEIMNGRWGDLVGVLYNSCTSTVEIQREMGITVLLTLFTVLSDTMTGYYQQLFQLFSITINDSNLLVQVTTVQGLGKIADFIETDDQQNIANFQQLIPSIVQVLMKALQLNDEDSCAKIFEVFDELLILEVPLLRKHFVDLLQLFLKISNTSDYSDEIRVQSLSFLIWCIMSAKSKIVKSKLVPTIIDSMIVIASENVDLDDDQDTPASLAINVINTMSTTMAPNQIIPALWDRVQLAMNTGKSGEKKAALLAVGGVIEGCADFLRPQISQIAGLILQNIRDPDTGVRRASCVALAQLLEDFETEICEMHQQILPVLYELISDDESVSPVALNALDSMLESMGDEIAPYVDGLMQKLLSVWGTGTITVRITTTNCIGSVAHSSGELFQPYFLECVKRLSELMVATDAEFLPLRSVATDCFGAAATAVGKETFRPYMYSVMEHVVAGLQLDHSGLKQCSYVLFGVLAKLYGSEFSVYLPTIVPPLLQACDQEESTDWLNDDDEGDFLDQEEPEGIKFASGIAQEKEFSLDTLGELFEATKSDFMPYLANSINISMSMLDHYNEGVRTTACETMFQFFAVSYEMSNPNDWTPGLPLKEPLHENVANIGKIAIEGAIVMLEDEDDRYQNLMRNTVTRTLHGLSDLLKKVGPAGVVQSFTGEQSNKGAHVDAIANLLVKILKREHPCQADDLSFGDESEESEEFAELDGLVIAAAADVVAGLSLVLGQQFESYFETFFPLLHGFCRNNSSSDRSMAIGVLAECCDGLEAGTTKFTEELLNLFTQALNDEDFEVKSNAAFGIGVLVANSERDTRPYFPTILSSLSPLFMSATKTNLIDNLCGCISRMILKAPDAIPLGEVLPAVLKALPLKNDFAENRPVFKMIIILLAQNNSVVFFIYKLIDALPHVIQLFSFVGSDTKMLDDATKTMIRNVCSIN